MSVASAVTESPEARALRESFHAIADAISSQESGPSRFGNLLWQEGFLINRVILSESGEGRYWKASQLLQTVESRVRATSGNTKEEFLKFIKILLKEPAYKDIATHLQQEYGKSLLLTLF